MLGSSQGSSQALSHFISRGAWKQADKDTRRKSRLAGVNSLAQGQKQRSCGRGVPTPCRELLAALHTRRPDPRTVLPLQP